MWRHTNCSCMYRLQAINTSKPLHSTKQVNQRCFIWHLPHVLPLFSLSLSSKAPLTEGPFRPAAIILFRQLRGLFFWNMVLYNAACACNHALHSVMMRLISVFCIYFCLFCYLYKHFNSNYKTSSLFLILNYQRSVLKLVTLAFVAMACCKSQHVH